MAASTAAQDLRGLERGAHACAAFDDRRAWLEMAAGFLADGVANGERVWLVGVDPNARRILREQLGDIDALLDDGQLGILDLDVYEEGQFVAADQTRVFAEAAATALRDGFAGLRVAADVSGLAAGAATRHEYRRYEVVVDELIARSPLVGLCGFDRRIVDGDVLGDLECLHRVGSSPPIRLVPSADGYALTGEVDVGCMTRFVRALQVLDLAAAPVLDLRHATFVDHNALVAVDAAARRSGAIVRVLTRSSTLQKVADALRVDHVVVDVER